MTGLPEFLRSPQGQRDTTDDALQRAVIAIEMRRPADAERIAGEVLKANRTNPRALQLLACALLMQGRHAEAIAPLEKALRRTGDPAVEIQLAMALREGARHDEALDRLRRTAARRPAYPDAFGELGRQLMSLGRDGEAIDVFERGLALMPNEVELSIQLGHALAARNNHAGARAQFARALTDAPGRVDVMVALAHTMHADGDYAQAADLFRRVLAIKPDAAARVALGLCLLELREKEPAFEHFRAAMRAGPQMFGQAVAALASSARGRFWLRPSDAARFMRGELA